MTGELLWSAEPPLDGIRTVFGAVYADSGAYGCSRLDLADVDGDGVDELIALHWHKLYFPTFVAAYRTDGSIIGPYYHWGHVNEIHVKDLDGDSEPEVLLAGTNNGAKYQGATLILLDAEHFAGASVDSLVGADCPVRDAALARVILPQYESHFMALFPARRLEARSVSVTRSEDQTFIQASIGDGQMDVLVVFDSELRPLRVAVTDALLVGIRSWPDDLREEFLSEQHWRRWLARAFRYGVDVRE
jgi:hypothetical protein